MKAKMTVANSSLRIIVAFCVATVVVGCPESPIHVAIAPGSDARNLEFLTLQKDRMTAASFFEVDVYECAVAESVDSSGTFWSSSGPRVTTERLGYGETPPGWTVRAAARPLVAGCYAAELGSSTVWFEVDQTGAIHEKPDSVYYRDLVEKYQKR